MSCLFESYGFLCKRVQTGALEGAFQLSTGQLTPLSEQQIVACAQPYGNFGCDGGNQGASFDFAADNRAAGGQTSNINTYGLASEGDYGYTEHDWEGGGVDSCSVSVSQTGQSQGQGTQNIDANEEALMEAVATYGPVAVSIYASDPSFMSYSNGRRAIFINIK